MSRTDRVVTALRRPRTAVAAGLVTLAVLVGGAALVTPPPTAAETAPVPEPVASTELVCGVTTASRTLTSTITAGVASLPSVTTGLATLADLTTSAAGKPSVITAPGASATRTVTGKPGPALLARATGSFAQGFGADTTLRSGQGPTRGLAVSPCARPVSDAWLVGGGSTVGRLTQVLLVNDDERPAQVDLLVYGLAGPVPAPGGMGIVLAPGSRKQVRVDALAPNQAGVAIHAIARTGRIGVLGLDQHSIGLVPLGMSLLPATEASTRVVIPEIPVPARYARLDLLSPDVDTTVRVTLLTNEGPVTPTGFATVQLQAGRVTPIDIRAALFGAPAGIVITSDTPVLAGAEVIIGAEGTQREKDATAGTAPLTAPGIVVGLAGGALKNAVLIAAPDAAAKVRLELFDPSSPSPVWTSTFDIASGSIAGVTVPVKTATATSILVVTPVSGGRIYATRQVTEAGARGPMVALAPILPQRATTLVPAVVSMPGSSVDGTTVR